MSNSLDHLLVHIRQVVQDEHDLRSVILLERLPSTEQFHLGPRRPAGVLQLCFPFLLEFLRGLRGGLVELLT